MELKIREQLLVEKCLTSIIHTYKCVVNNEAVFMNGEADIYEKQKAELDLKLDFLSFLNQNKPEEVKYGLDWLSKRKQDTQVYELLYPMILEYNNYGLEGALQCIPIEEHTITKSQEHQQKVEASKTTFNWNPIEKTFTRNKFKDTFFNIFKHWRFE